MQVSLKKHGLPGLLVAVCGADGTGKSTVLKSLAHSLEEQRNKDVNLVRLKQPSDWWRSDPHVQSTLMMLGDAEVFDELALGVFGVADRFNQQAMVIEPALAAGHTVLMDRYVYCLLAYYMARDEPLLDHLAGMCRPLFQPDITFVIDCPPQIAIDRVIKRDGPNAKRTDQQLDPTTRFIEAYRTLAQSNQLHLLSSLDTPDALLGNVLDVLRVCRPAAHSYSTHTSSASTGAPPDGNTCAHLPC